MPFALWRSNGLCRVLGVLGGGLDLNAVKCITREASKHPEKCTDRQYRLYLCRREISAQNINNGNHTANDAHVEPPDDPVVNPQMKMHNRSTHVDVSEGAMGTTVQAVARTTLNAT